MGIDQINLPPELVHGQPGDFPIVDLPLPAPFGATPGEVTPAIVPPINAPQDPLQTIIQHSPDPKAAVDKIQAVGRLSKMFGIPPQVAWKRFDSLSAIIYGKPVDPPGVLKKLNDSINNAKVSLEIADLSGRQYLGDTSKETQAKIDKLQAQMSPDPLSDIPDAIVKLVYGIGYAGYHAAGTVADDTAAALSGELLLKAVGGHPLTHFAQMGHDEANKVFGTLVGSAYGGLVKDGVNPVVARVAAGALGAIQAIAFVLPASKLPGVEALVGKVTGAVAKRLLDGTIERVVTSTWRRLGGVLTEQALYALGLNVANAVIPESAKVVSNVAAGTSVALPSAAEIVKNVVAGTIAQTIVAGATGGLGIIAEHGLRGRIADVARTEAEKAGVPAKAPGTEVSPAEPITTKVESSIGIEGLARVSRYITGGTEAAAVHSTILDSGTVKIEDVALGNHPDFPTEREAVIRFMHEHQGQKIEWTPKTETGKAVKAALIKDNPRAIELQDKIKAEGELITVLQHRIATAQASVKPALMEQLATAQQTLEATQSRFAGMDLQWFAEDKTPETQPLGKLLPGEETPAEPLTAKLGRARSELKALETQHAKLLKSSTAKGVAKTEKVIAKLQTQVKAYKGEVRRSDAALSGARTVANRMAKDAAEKEAVLASNAIAKLETKIDSYKSEMRRDKAALSAAGTVARQIAEDTATAKAGKVAGKLQATIDAYKGEIRRGEAALSGARSVAGQMTKDAAAKEVAKNKTREEVKRLIKGVTKIDPGKMRPEWGDPVRHIQAAFDPKRMGKRSLDKLSVVKAKLLEDEYATLTPQEQALIDRAARTPYRDLTLEDLRAVHDVLKYYEKMQRDSNQVMVGARKLEREVAKETVMREMPEAKHVQDTVYRLTPDVPTRMRKAKNWVKLYFGDHMRGLDFIAATIGGKTEDSLAYKGLFKQVHEGEGPRVEYNGGELGKLRFAHEVNDAQGTERKALIDQVKNVDKWRGEHVQTGKFDLTHGERVSLLMLLDQGASKDDLMAAGFGSRSMPDKNAIYTPTAEEWTILSASITPQEREAARALSAGFRSMGLKISEQFLRVKNYSMAVVDKYFPMDVMPISRGSSEEAQSGMAMAKAKYWNIGMPKGRTITRTGAIKPLYVRDAFEVFAEHRDWGASYVHIDQPLLNAAKLLRDIRGGISARWGEGVYSELETRLRKVAGEAPQESGIEKFMRRLRSSYIQSVLSLNPVSIISNLMNFERAISSGLLKTHHAVLGLMDSLAHPLQVHRELKLWSPEYRAFHVEGGFSKDEQDALRAQAKNTPLARGAKKVRNLLAYPTRLTDRLMVRATMRGAFFQAMDEMRSSNLSPEVRRGIGISGEAAQKLSTPEQMALGYRYGEYVIEHVNSVPLASLKSGLHLGNWFEQTVGALGSDAVRAQQLWFSALRDVTTHSPKALRRFGALTVGLALIEPLHYVLVNYWRQEATAKRKPPSLADIKAAFMGSKTPAAGKARKYIAFQSADQVAYYFPVIRDFARPIIAGVTGGGYSSNSMLITDEYLRLSNEGATALRMWSTAPTPRQRQKYGAVLMDRTVHLMSALTGNPYGAEKLAGKLTGVIK